MAAISVTPNLSRISRGTRAADHRLRVLILERTAAAARRSLAHLQRSGYQVESRIATSRRQFEEALAAGAYDVVVARDTLPGFNALEALILLREQGRDEAMVVLTASRSNALVQQCLRKGAADYISTSDLGRLPTTVCYITTQQRRRDLGAEPALFQAIVESIQEVFFIVDLSSGRAMYTSPAAERCWGARYETLDDFLGVVPDEDQPVLLDALERVRQGRDSGEYQFRIRKPDGEVRWIQGHMVPIRDPDGGCAQATGVNLDITERKMAQLALEESESRFRKLFEATFDGILVAQDGIMVETNPGLARIFGYEPGENIGHPALDLVAEEDRELAARMVREGFEGTYRVGGVRKDGGRLKLEVTARMHTLNGRPCRITAVRDMTDRDQLEQQFRHAQKMEAVGRLAGGVAHDFNNLLTVISSYSEMLLANLAWSDPRRADLEEIQHAATTAANLTRQLLAFSRQQVVQPRLIQVDETIRSTARLLKRLIGEDIELAITHHDGPAHIHMDPGQMEQVIMNLAVNARDAMPAGGRLTIETRIATLGPDYTHRHWPATPGRYVQLSISDNGSGMTREVQNRIFEPFFTTKEAGKGTGLGLATVYGIVKQNGGFIWVYSEVGQGTTFKIYLPIVEGAGSTEAAVRQTTPAAPRGTETILVAEDAGSVRTVVRQVLERLGYAVMEAGNGAAALEVVTRRECPVNLLLTDLVMPGMSGRELADQVHLVEPGLKVLFMSGYTDDAVVRHGLLGPGTAYIQKPFTGDQLAVKIRGLLDQ